MTKWLCIVLFCTPALAWGLEESLKTPLSAEQIFQQDRFVWHSIAPSSTLPPSSSIDTVQQAIEGRTSLILHPERQWVAYDPSALRNYPFLHWEMCGLPPPLSLEDTLHFRDFFNAGGTLYLDYCDGTTDYAEWKAWGTLIYPDTKWEALQSAQVLAHSFYLLKKHLLLQGRQAGVFTLENDGRFIMILNQNPRLAWKAFEKSLVSKNYNTPLNEMRLRFYINLLMYLLTGSYKADQLHLPTILLRRK